LIALLLISNSPIESSAQPVNQPSIEELTKALQDKYDSVLDFSANFKHMYEGGVLRTTLTEHGTVHVKKPGMMRWHYTEPEEKYFISNGATLYSHIPLDRKVFVEQISIDDHTSTPALFLAGKIQISKEFVVTYDRVFNEPENSWILRLTPRLDHAEYEWLTLAIDSSTLSITQLITIDFQGGISTFTFTNIKENQDLEDSLFVFDTPSDTEVLNSQPEELR
jgi:outer membrane lipoprotein carrier protein